MFTAIVSLVGMPALFAQGQEEEAYPEKAVTVICAFPAGGLADIIARTTAQAYEEELGVPFQVINKPGGAFIPGVMSVIEAPADGYTMLMVATPTILTAPYINNAPYTHEELEYLFLNSVQKNVLYVPANSDIQDMEDFVEAARSKKLIVGINAVGAPPHLSMEQFVQSADLEVEYLTAGTVPAAVVAGIGGHSDAFVGQLTQLDQYPGEIRALAVLDESGSDILPGVPTVAEALPGTGYYATSWVRAGFAVKKGTPQEYIDILVATAEKVINTEEFRTVFEDAGNPYEYIGYGDATSVVEDGADFYFPMIDDLGLKKK